MTSREKLPQDYQKKLQDLRGKLSNLSHLTNEDAFKILNNLDLTILSKEDLIKIIHLLTKRETPIMSWEDKNIQKEEQWALTSFTHSEGKDSVEKVPLKTKNGMYNEYVTLYWSSTVYPWWEDEEW